jgi:hypothetical protein
MGILLNLHPKPRAKNDRKNPKRLQIPSHHFSSFLNLWQISNYLGSSPNRGGGKGTAIISAPGVRPAHGGTETAESTRIKAILKL